VHRHTRKVLKVYAERRALIAQLLREELAEHLHFDLPDGGLAVWARFAPSVDMLRLVDTARRERLQLLPGSAFSLSGRDVQGARLGFASLDELELRRAVQRLRAALRKLR
jgi:GntR family transcriptional regulator / MocR family aminotransferase